MNCLVSVIVPCYNAEKYIDSFFKYILHQTYRPIEVILVNDGSIDSTDAKIKLALENISSDDCLFKYYSIPHSGQAAAMNLGFKKATGNFLMWTDIDDILLKNNIQIKIDYLRKHPEIDFVLTNGYSVADSNLSVAKDFIGRNNTSDDSLTFFFDLLNENDVSYGPGAILIKRSSFLNVFPKGEIIENKEGQNWQLILPLAYLLKHHVINEIACLYVESSESHSRKNRTIDEQLQRNDEFLNLTIAVVESIHNINEDDRFIAKKILLLKYIQKNLYICYKNFLFNRRKKYIKVLKENNLFRFRHTYIGYSFYRIFQKVKNRKRYSKVIDYGFGTE